MGVNGAGKSTLLKLCIGLLIPDSGNITINSNDIMKERFRVLKQIGVLHENPKFPRWMVVEQYLVSLATIRGFSKSEAIGQTNYLLQKLGLEESRHKHLNELSAGLNQRFGIAQAVIGIPKIIFLDEPTANLDVSSRYRIMEFLKSISDKFDTTIIIMSHILSDLERYCDSIAILDEGTIKYQDSVQNLISGSSYKYYLIRNADGKPISNIEHLDLNIIKKGNREIILRVSHQNQINEIRENLPDGTSISPYLSLLEQVFVEITGHNPFFDDLE